MGTLDYRFSFGKYDGMLEANNTTGEAAKILALSNILRMRPGTLQDCPECGLDTDGLQFVEEGNEKNEAISRIQTSIRQLANQYIEDGFVTSVEFKITNVSPDIQDGTQTCSINIGLRTGTAIILEGETSKNGLRVNTVNIDKTPFISESLYT